MTRKRPSGRLASSPEARIFTIPAKFSAKEARAVKAAAKEFGVSVSEFVRSHILRGLSP